MDARKTMQKDEDAKNNILQNMRRYLRTKIATGIAKVSYSAAIIKDVISSHYPKIEIDEKTDKGLPRRHSVMMPDGKSYHTYDFDDVAVKYGLNGQEWQNRQNISKQQAAWLRSVMEYEATRQNAVADAYHEESLHRGFIDTGKQKSAYAAENAAKESLKKIYKRNCALFKKHNDILQYWLDFTAKFILSSAEDKEAEITMGTDCFVLGWHYSEMKKDGKIVRNAEVRKNFQHALPDNFFSHKSI